MLIDGLFLPDILGYIDPGSGSIVIQVIVGAIIGLGVTMKIYWFKLKSMFFNITKKDD